MHRYFKVEQGCLLRMGVVPADGRGEMGVKGGGQAVVAVLRERMLPRGEVQGLHEEGQEGGCDRGQKGGGMSGSMLAAVDVGGKT